MATDEYKPGQEVPTSGIYRVSHNRSHALEHEVTCVKGEPFPSCKNCGEHPRFVLVHAAHHVANHELFRKW